MYLKVEHFCNIEISYLGVKKQDTKYEWLISRLNGKKQYLIRQF